jgi:carboxyl-terminal processing protease
MSGGTELPFLLTSGMRAFSSLANCRILVGCLAFTAACGSADGPISIKQADPHVAAIAYLDSAINIMKAKGFYRRRVNWDSVRANAHVAAAGAIAPSDTYAAIRQALLALGDHHSFLFLPASASVAELAGHPIDSLSGELLNGRYGYIRVPTFSPLVKGANEFALADTLQGFIRAVDANNPCGWVVDLRRNGGGDMWPMLVGVGPLLGNDEHVGSFVDADSVVSTWFYSAGVSGYTVGGQRIPISHTSQPYTLRSPNPPVAVLTDGGTASSGEAIVVAFRALPRARSFGAATAGVPTANVGYPLSDQAQLFIMVALDADRNGTWYSDRIAPDEPVALFTFPATDDAVVAAALKWLATRAPCSGT